MRRIDTSRDDRKRSRSPRGERERERAGQLVLELLPPTVETVAAQEAAPRLEGELAALRSRSWWRRLLGWRNCQPPAEDTEKPVHAVAHQQQERASAHG
jgi:hypothetical protein